MLGIAAEGCRPWHDDKKIKVHYCRQNWEGEGQWRSGSLEELGLYPTCIHNCSSTIQFSSIGSFSTARYSLRAALQVFCPNSWVYGRIRIRSDSIIKQIPRFWYVISLRKVWQTESKPFLTWLTVCAVTCFSRDGSTMQMN